METVIWMRFAFIGGMLALAALAVATELLIDRLGRRPTSRALHGPGVPVAPAGGRP
jgi:hypothetical protein